MQLDAQKRTLAELISSHARGENLRAAIAGQAEEDSAMLWSPALSSRSSKYEPLGSGGPHLPSGAFFKAFRTVVHRALSLSLSLLCCIPLSLSLFLASSSSSSSHLFFSSSSSFLLLLLHKHTPHTHTHTQTEGFPARRMYHQSMDVAADEDQDNDYKRVMRSRSIHPAQEDEARHWPLTPRRPATVGGRGDRSGRSGSRTPRTPRNRAVTPS